MSSTPVTGVPTSLEKKPVKFSNLLLGAGLNIVTTLGQPLEVVKTTMAANRSEGLTGAIGRIWARGGAFGFYQGLIPWAWIEASTKGAVLLFVASEAEYYAKSFGAPDFLAGISGGMTGGLAQAYATMGFCTCMKTVEITKHKVAATGAKPPGTLQTFMGIWRAEGLRGINRGVNAVAVRQVTNWGSRFGLSRVAETGIRRVMDKQQGEKLTVVEKITASALGGGLSAWNQPIEVIRVELQSKTVDPNRPKNLNVASAFRYIYGNNGIKGLYRGVTPRIGLGVWQTVCMVALGDVAKEAVEKLTGDKFPYLHGRPEVKAWRCDLTALSQLYNLYFVACNNTIHIYKPSFPHQGLSSEPELILHPPVSSVTGTGIDSQDPHSINRVLVDYLGREEILLAACDDGDVVGYRVEEIQRALERRTTSSDGRLEHANEDDIKVFLHRNVGASAWGLAVHREARIIAVSANTHRITIIAYALADPFPYSRQRESVFTLSAATNIPAISFNNNGDDPIGRWLLSSSIDGKTILWDLHTRKQAAVWQIGWCTSAESRLKAPSNCSCPDRADVIHGAWGVMTMDTRTAHEMTSTEEVTLGPAVIAPGFNDVSAYKKQFHGLTTQVGSSSESNEESSAMDIDEMESGEAEVEQSMSTGNPTLDDAIQQHPQVQLEPEETPIPPMQSKRPYCEFTIRADPCVILTKEDIHIIQRPCNEGESRESGIASMRRALHLGPWTPVLAPEDRHCFFTQIPDIGAFIVASPAGLAGVFSLYYTRKRGFKRYSFKPEYLLPFMRNGTNVTMGTSVRLIGVAVGPVQGMYDEVSEECEIMPQPRRWRVLMYYMDHTVMSFELSKEKVGDSLRLDELIV
ncbi:mitochondrial carrier [Clathrospora elynae]|uniref:Mitochondrial carrier n=1 Tax=Clathrospora elynae TaxID=706981 RepID=A0A6A5SEZ4_9PLEO|nr:mitochondrial carrier [Clathrospora elynae]